MQEKLVLASVAAAGGMLLASSASASLIYGLNLRGDNMFFQSTTDDFVGNYGNIGGATYDSFALDMDTSATTMYTALWDGGATNEFGTIDVTTGAFTSSGQLSGPNIGDNISGLSVNPVTGDWYLSAIEAGGAAILYRGDITTGVFTAVGDIGFGLNIDIAIDGQGNAYGHDIQGDQLLSIDLTTGAGTPIGSTGFDANFAQGMDFDYSTGLLYATLYTGGGTGQFGTFDLTTGALNVLQETTSLNAEMEIAVAQAIPAPGALALFGLLACGSRRRRK